MSTSSNSSEAPADPHGVPELPLRFAELDIGRIAYVEVGTGSPLLLVHGFGDDLTTWRYQLRGLASVARVIALDLPGFGRSDKPHIDYTPAVFVDTLCAFLDYMGLEKVALAGSSMGGAAVLGVTIRQTARVDRLALISPTTPGVVPEGRVFDIFFRLVQGPSLGFRAVQLPWLAMPLVRHPSRWMVRAGLREAMSKGAVIDDATVDYYLSVMRQEGFAHAYVSTAVHWRKWGGFRPRVTEIRQPTLLLWGEFDRIHPVRQSGLLRTLIPETRFVTLPCGHLSQVERPEEVNAELKTWLANH